MTADQARRIGELLGVPVASVHRAGAQHGYQHLTARLADGRQAFVKAAPGGDEATAGAFAAEANALRWLAEAGAEPLPELLGVSHDLLVNELLPDGRATPDAADGRADKPADPLRVVRGHGSAPWTTRPPTIVAAGLMSLISSSGTVR